MCAALHTSAPRGRLLMSDRCSFGASGKLIAAEGMNVCARFNGFREEEEEEFIMVK